MKKYKKNITKLSIRLAIQQISQQISLSEKKSLFHHKLADWTMDGCCWNLVFVHGSLKVLIDRQCNKREEMLASSTLARLWQVWPHNICTSLHWKRTKKGGLFQLYDKTTKFISEHSATLHMVYLSFQCIGWVSLFIFNDIESDAPLGTKIIERL